MTWLTFTTLLVSVMALLSSIGAWYAAARSLRLCRSSSSARQSQRLTEIESMLEELSLEQKRIRQARNLAAHRARKAAEPEEPGESAAIDGSETPEQTRARLNDELARSQRRFSP